jgi:molybdate transport system substrate-binding protein
MLESFRPSRRRTAAGLIGGLFAAAVLAIGAPARADGVLVFAAASTTDAVNAIIAAYGKTGGKVKASYASSSTLARQIVNGAPASIFISADQKWMDYVAKADRIATGTRRDLLRNSLVLIAPMASKAAIKIVPGFHLAAALGKDRLAIGDPDHVPAGIYARQALTHLGVWKQVADKTARARDVRAALALVERGETPFGIVYSTDAKASSKVRIVGTFPRDSHPPIVYPAALIAGHDTAEAKRFFAFMTSPNGARIFARFGFTVD